MAESNRPGMRRALGRGIGALIPSNAGARRPSDLGDDAGPATEAATGLEVLRVPLDTIDVNPRQPRSHFDQEALEELARSIRESGVIQPALVRPLEGGRYQLIAGERRLRASRLAGAATIPVLVQDMSEDAALVVALVENIQRAELGPLEEARAFQQLGEEFGLTQDEVARRVGRSRPAIANSLRLLKLPEAIQKDLAAGRLSAGHARALLALDGEAAQRNLAEEIIRRSLNVREAEAAVAARKPDPAGRRVVRADPDLARVESDLGRGLGTKVRIRTGPKGRGRVELEFYSDDDLARLVGLLERVPRSAPKSV